MNPAFRPKTRKLATFLAGTGILTASLACTATPVVGQMTPEAGQAVVRQVHFAPKAVSSVYGWCNIETPTGLWRVTHPKNYGINQLSVAEALAQKHQCHVITHHEHHAAIGHDRYKRFVIVNNGALVDDRKLAYVQLDDSKSAGMAKAFTLLRNGHPHLLANSPMTDWTRWV